MPLPGRVVPPFFYRCFLLPVLTMSGKMQKRKITKIQKHKNTKERLSERIPKYI